MFAVVETLYQLGGMERPMSVWTKSNSLKRPQVTHFKEKNKKILEKSNASAVVCLTASFFFFFPIKKREKDTYINTHSELGVFNVTKSWCRPRYTCVDRFDVFHKAGNTVTTRPSEIKKKVNYKKKTETIFLFFFSSLSWSVGRRVVQQCVNNYMCVVCTYNIDFDTRTNTHTH